jgi:nitrogen regulatory protein PII
MKRIEMVITPWTLDAFKEAARQLGISDFDLIEVYRSGCATVETQQRLYRGHEFAADLLPRLRLEFVLLDDDVQTALHQLLQLVHPESIAVFKTDQTVWPAKGYHTSSPPLRHNKETDNVRFD